MDADVADQNGVCRKRAVDLVGSPLRIDRARIVLEARCNMRVPFPAIAVDRGEPFRARGGNTAAVARVIELRHELADECAHVGHQSQRNRVVARDLIRIDVDVNEPGRRNGEGISGQPGARRAVSKRTPSASNTSACRAAWFA